MKCRWILMIILVLVPTSWGKQLPLQYAVKFVCGKSNGTVVAPGLYFTAVNVHNPADRGVKFLKKVAVALPDEKAGPITPLASAELGPDGAVEIDCKEILARAKKEGFLKGFVVLESEEELDVVGVYTAAGATRQIETMEIERVPVRHVSP
jgi:hypothetical protein